MIGTTAALLGTAAVQAGGSLLGGLFGKSQAQKAAEEQARAAAAAGKRVQDTVEQVNPLITGAARTAGEQSRAAAGESTARVDAATQQANAFLDPYRQTGEKATTALSSAIDTSGHMPTLEELQMDPGYEFRRKEGEKTLLSRAAALGVSTGGGTAKALVGYGQDMATQEYANAFARFTQQRQQNIQNLLNISGQGLQAGTTEAGNVFAGGKYGADLNYDSTNRAGDLNLNALDRTTQNTVDAAKTVGDYEVQGANVKAAGRVGGSNALINGIAGAGNAATSAATLATILKNPASKYRSLVLRNPSLDAGVAA